MLFVFTSIEQQFSPQKDIEKKKIHWCVFMPNTWSSYFVFIKNKQPPAPHKNTPTTFSTTVVLLYFSLLNQAWPNLLWVVFVSVLPQAVLSSDFTS